MIHTEVPSQGLLFSSFLFRDDLFSTNEFKKLWESQFQEGFSFVPTLNPLSDYYKKEMGGDLSRIFFLTSKVYPREFLLSTKLLALNWERQLAQNSKRMVNVDVGFLSLENFILATTKNYSHRIYLAQNIFTDLTYYFHQGELQTLPWTYPDYMDEEKKQFFTWARTFLLQKLSY
jgi:hypothetical protein